MFFNNKENKVIGLMVEHLEVIEKALLTFQQFIEAYCDDEGEGILKELSYKVHIREHEADEVQQKIQQNLIEGAFLPFYRENFLKIPEMVDKLPGLAVKICKEVFLFNIKLPEKLRPCLKNLTKSVLETFNEFLKIFEYLPNDFKNLVKVADKVRILEQEVDKIEWKAKLFLFKEENNLNLTEKMFFKELITLIADIADKIENAVDYIQLTMIKMKV